MRALVLSGGGARGAYEAGAVSALLRSESYDLVCGVSVGSINAALLAAGAPDALETFWLHAFPQQVPTLFPHVSRLRRIVADLASLGVGGPWENAIRFARAASEFRFFRQLGRIHRATLPAIASALGEMIDFASLRTSIVAGATNVSHVRAAAFYAAPPPAVLEPENPHNIEYRAMNAGNFVLSLLASAAMPGLFSPVALEFDGESAQYADGCIVYNSPLSLAIDAGATDITVIFVDPKSEYAHADLGLTQLATNVVTLWQQRALEYEVRLASAMNEIRRLGGATQKRYITIREVRPEREIDLDILAFDDAPRMRAAFDLGVRDGARGAQTVLHEPPAPTGGEAVNLWERIRRLRPPWSGEETA